MITKERLEELIKQESMIYYPLGRTGIMSVPLNDIKYKEQYCLECYETEEEAEFVAKNHDTRIEKFKPPFEVEKYNDFIFLTKNYSLGKISNVGYAYLVITREKRIFKHFDTY